MEQSQIIRLPKKYGELFSTLSNEEAGKLIKEIFGYDSKIEGLSRVYRDMINVDIGNMESSAINGKKGGRPKKTPGFKKGKPQDIENDNLNEEKNSEKKIKEDKNREVIGNKIEMLDTGSVRYDFYSFLLEIEIEQEIKKETIASIDEKLEYFYKALGKQFIPEMESFIIWHKENKTKFSNVLLRLNSWFSKKLPN